MASDSISKLVGIPFTNLVSLFRPELHARKVKIPCGEKAGWADTQSSRWLIRESASTLRLAAYSCAAPPQKSSDCRVMTVLLSSVAQEASLFGTTKKAFANKDAEIAKMLNPKSTFMMVVVRQGTHTMSYS